MARCFKQKILITHTYNDELAKKLTFEIKNVYLPELEFLYKKLSEEKE